MKVNQIVSEHKKGVRAHIYNKKATTKATGPVPLYGPDKQEAKMTPYKAPKTKAVMEADTPVAPGAPIGKIEKVDPATKTATIKTPSGEEITQQLDQTSKVDDQTVAMAAPASNPQELVGDNVVAKEDNPIADKLPYGTPVDTREVFYVTPGSDGEPRLKVTDSPNVDSLPKIVRLPKLDVPGYDIASKGFRAINIELPGSKQRVGAFMSGRYVYANTESFNKLQQALQARQPEMSKLRESDNVLLDKMLTIAGLR